MDKWTQSLSTLLPQGYAWPRQPGTVLMQVMQAQGAKHQALYDWCHATAFQWMPHNAVARLAEWEAAVGLPDPCFGTSQTTDQRRQRVLSRVRGQDMPYADSSPGAPGLIAAACAEIGYAGVTVRYNKPLRCGKRLGQRLGALDGRLYVLAPVSSKPFRCGQRAGARLVSRIGAGPDLACHLERVVPARFSINIIFQ
jgi:uncharacterized protein YmfQ (DUF2313 family)